MTTARTHRVHTGMGAPRPRSVTPKDDRFAVPVEAEVEAEGVEPFDPSALDFDPADHNVDDVKAYVEEHPEHADAILELELNGKQRSGVLSFIENFEQASDDES